MWNIATYCYFYKYAIVYIITTFIGIKSIAAITCRTGCECRYYPRRPIICTLAPGLSSFPNDIPAGTLALSISGTLMNRNHFGHITRTNFDNVSSLRFLTLSFCEIVSIDDGVFSTLKGLQTLQLQNNQIKHITAGTFDGPTKLSVLDLSGNKNCVLDSSALDNLASLQELYLGEMEINVLDKALFSHLVDLRILDLHGNHIKEIHPATFQSFSKLEYLDLTGNLIKTMPNETGPILSKLHTLHLGDNPWHCNCELKWLRTLPIKHIYDKDNAGQTVICSSPDPLKYRSFVDVDESELHCTPPKIVSCDKNTISVHLSDYISVSCVIRGDPFPEVSWNRQNGDQFKLATTMSGSVHVLENGTLEISQSSAQDEGTWTLIVSNNYGNQEHKIQVHVVLPTTTTKSTTTTTTSTTTATTKITTLTSQSTARATARPTTHSRPSTTRDTPASTTDKVTDSVKKKDSDQGDNTILLIAGGAGGGAFLGLCGAVIYCIKRKKNQNKVRDAPPEEDFDSVKSSRRPKRNTVKTPLYNSKRPVHRTHSYLDF